jgi:hypothetical protein
VKVVSYAFKWIKPSPNQRTCYWNTEMSTMNSSTTAKVDADASR